MDDFVKNMLVSWNMVTLIPSFEENEIDEESFSLLDTDTITHIIPKPGPRLKFLKKFQDYNDQNESINTAYKILATADNSVISKELVELNEDEQENSTVFGNSFNNSEEDNEENCEPTVKRSKPSEPYTNSMFPGGLQQYLESTTNGKIILSNKDKINEKIRCLIARCVVDFLLLNFLTNGNTISKSKFLQAREEIVHLFPKENKETYFVPYKSATKTAPRTLNCGKLWTRFNNYKKSLGKDSSENSPSPNTSINSDLETTADINASLLFLRSNLEPFEEILKHWTKTFLQRSNILQNQSIAHYFQEFPILRMQDGCKLLLSDFNKTFDELTSNKLYSRWEDFAQAICVNLVEKEILTNDLITAQNRDAIALNNFAYLFPQTTIRGKTQKGGKKTWRPSRLESQKSFFLHLGNESDYAEEIGRRQTKLLESGETVQPFILCIGELSSPSRIYVVINEQKYVMESVVKALDTCFKCIFALNASYSSESVTMWNFLQRHVYEIHEQHEKNYTGISSVLSDLKRAGFN